MLDVTVGANRRPSKPGGPRWCVETLQPDGTALSVTTAAGASQRPRHHQRRHHAQDGFQPLIYGLAAPAVVVPPEWGDAPAVVVTERIVPSDWGVSTFEPVNSIVLPPRPPCGDEFA